MSISFSLLAPTPGAQAQDEEFDEAPALDSSRPRQKKLKNLKGKDLQQDIAEKAAGKFIEAFFPDWPTPEFSWRLSPVIGVTYTDEYLDDVGHVKTTTFEGGIAAGISGIPLVPGNAGLYVEPSAGYVFGSLTQIMKSDDGEYDAADYGYHRAFADVDFLLFWRWYRHTLGIGRGQKIYDDEDKFPKVQSAQVTNDFGVLILNWISGHYTHRFLRVFQDSFSEPSLEEQDNWLHASIFTSVLGFHVDFGPGFTVAEEFADDTSGDSVSVAKGRADYVLVTAGLNPFWKLGVSGRAKYVYASTEDNLGASARTKLPEESLYEPPSVVMPEDSLVASSFIGVRDLFFGLGLGWYYNIQILNWSEHENRDRETTKNQGFGFSYQASF